MSFRIMWPPANCRHLLGIVSRVACRSQKCHFVHLEAVTGCTEEGASGDPVDAEGYDTSREEVFSRWVSMG